LKDIICICGTNPITRALTDWSLDADFWYFNESVSGSREHEGWLHEKPVNGVFQMHVPPIWRNKNNPTHPGHYGWLQESHDFPVYMIDQFSDVPSCIKYPKDEIITHLLPNFQNELGDVQEYFTSTAAYAIALAIHLGYKEIRLYGIEAANDTDYLRQRAGITFWCGLAIGFGVKLVRLSKSLLMNEPIYGYKGEVMIQKQELEIAAGRWNEEAAKAQSIMFEKQGAVNNTFNLLMQTKSQKEANRLSSQFQEQLKDLAEWQFKYGFAFGALSENKRYLKEVDALINAAGGEKALQAIVNGDRAEVPEMVVA
jgi:hypothetical protein